MVYKQKTVEEKKQEIDDLTKQTTVQIQQYFRSPEDMKEYLDFLGNFHQYSLNNSMLIDAQFSGAHAVGSFAFWKSKGFSVNKGEKGIKILVPKVVTYFDRNGQETQLKYATKDERERINKKDIQTKKRTFFDIGHVFDVSQTNASAEDLPSIFPNKWLEGNVSDYAKMYSSLEKIAEQYDIRIVEPYNELGAAKGVSYTLLREVALNPRNSEIQNVKTLVHELAHAVLHNEETHKNYSTQEKEFQAEMVAYTVSSYFGIDTSDYSLPYLHHWTDGKELKDQEKLLHEVRQTAHDFITIIEEDLIRDREISNEKDEQQEEKQDILLVEYQHLSITKQKLLTFKELINIADMELNKLSSLPRSTDETQNLFIDQDINQLKEMLKNKSNQKLFIESFNQKYAQKFTALDTTEITRPNILIQWSESADLKSNTMAPFGEMNFKMEKLEEQAQKDTCYYKTRYHLIFPKEYSEDDTVTIVNMDRLDLGDGTYINPHHQIHREKDLTSEQTKAIDKEFHGKLLVEEEKDFDRWMQHRQLEALKILDTLDQDKENIKSPKKIKQFDMER